MQKAYHRRVRDPSAARLEEAARRHHGGDTTGALEMAREEVRLNPSALRPRLLESLFLLELNRVEESFAAANEALRLDASAGDAYYRRAMASLALGRPGDAENDLRRAREVSSWHPGATNELALLWARRGEAAAAAQLLESFLAVKPENAVARANLARMPGHTTLAGGEE